MHSFHSALIKMIAEAVGVRDPVQHLTTMASGKALLGKVSDWMKASR